MDIKIKLAITAASVLVASTAAYLITKRTLKADDALWAEASLGESNNDTIVIDEK